MTPEEFDKRIEKVLRDLRRRDPSLFPASRRPEPRMHDYAIRLGKVDSDVTAPASATVSIYRGTTKGSETDTTENVTAYLRYSELTAGSWCHVAYIDGGWEIIVGDPC